MCEWNVALNHGMSGSIHYVKSNNTRVASFSLSAVLQYFVLEFSFGTSICPLSTAYLRLDTKLVLLMAQHCFALAVATMAEEESEIKDMHVPRRANEFRNVFGFLDKNGDGSRTLSFHEF